MTKKLELATKSPMISAVPATLQGLIIIRVYNQGGRFVREFMDMVYNSTKTFVFLTRTSRLFAIVLETPIQLLTVSGVWIFIIIIMNYEVDPGLLGLSLTLSYRKVSLFLRFENDLFLGPLELGNYHFCVVYFATKRNERPDLDFSWKESFQKLFFL